MKTLYLIRGLSGSGKTTLANIIWDAMAWRNMCDGKPLDHPNAVTISADDFFTEYGYSVSVIECQSEFDNVHGVPPHVIEKMSNRWENISP